MSEKLIYFLLSSAGRIPIRARVVIGRLVGRLVAMFPSREREIASLQLDLHLPEAGGRSLVPSVFASAGQTAMESINLRPYLSDPDRHVHCGDWDAIRSWISSGRPIVALTAHTPNWDLLAAYFIAKGIPLTTIGREAKSRRFQYSLEKLREAYGVKVIWRSDGAGLKQIVSELKEGKIVSALIDQDTKVSSVHVPFFGELASTPSGLVVLAKKYKALVVVPLISREGDRYRIRVSEISTDGSVEDVLAEYNRRLETHIREHPEQWVWFHKRWRTLPDGDVLSSKAYLGRLRSRVSERGGSASISSEVTNEG